MLAYRKEKRFNLIKDFNNLFTTSGGLAGLHWSSQYVKKEKKKRESKTKMVGYTDV